MATMLLDRTIVGPIDRALLVAFAGQESLLLTDPNGLVIDSLAVPVLRRRGIPDDVEERMRAEGTMEAAWPIASYQLASERLANGHVAIMHAEMPFKDLPFLREVFVSLLSLDRKRACVGSPRALPRSLEWCGDRVTCACGSSVARACAALPRRRPCDRTAAARSSHAPSRASSADHHRRVCCVRSTHCCATSSSSSSDGITTCARWR